MRKAFLWLLLVMVVASPGAFATTILSAGSPYVVDAGHDVGLLQWAWELTGSPSDLTLGSKLVIENSSGRPWTGLGFSVLIMPPGWGSNTTVDKIEFEVTAPIGDFGIFKMQANDLNLPPGFFIGDDTGASTLTSEGPLIETDPLFHVPVVIPEASTYLLFGLGALGLAVWRRRKCEEKQGLTVLDFLRR